MSWVNFDLIGRYVPEQKKEHKFMHYYVLLNFLNGRVGYSKLGQFISHMYMLQQKNAA